VSSAAGSPRELIISDAKSARIAIKKALQFFFQESPDDTQHRKIPENRMVYALSRAFRWSKVIKPPEQEHIAQIEGPNEPKQKYIAKLFNNKDWNTLIPEVEYNFITNDSFTFWLEAQRYVVLALEQKSGVFDEIADEIKSQLARLVAKLPGLTALVFKDTTTPFAGKETVDWIENEVMSSLGGGKTKEKILPPILDDDYEPINKMYESACEELPENFIGNAKTMQQAMDGEARKKGRFLRLLNLANYCHLAKQYLLAQPLFGQLMQQIEDYHICDWETPLCVAVWQSTFLNNQKLLSVENDETNKANIERQQKGLFDQIVKFDAVLALTLENHIKNEGE